MVESNDVYRTTARIPCTGPRAQDPAEVQAPEDSSRASLRTDIGMYTDTDTDKCRCGYMYVWIGHPRREYACGDDHKRSLGWIGLGLRRGLGLLAMIHRAGKCVCPGGCSTAELRSHQREPRYDGLSVL